MTTQTIEIDGRLYVPEGPVRRGLRALRARLGRAGVTAVAGTARTVASVVGAKSVPAVSHIKEHAYTIIGFGMFDAAMFVHSLYTGLIVTGVSWVVFEWKVEKEGEDDATNR